MTAALAPRLALIMGVLKCIPVVLQLCWHYYGHPPVYTAAVTGQRYNHSHDSLTVGQWPDPTYSSLLKQQQQEKKYTGS